MKYLILLCLIQFSFGIGNLSQGYSNYNDSNFAESINSYQEASIEEPSALAFYNLGAAHYSQKEYIKAAESFAKAISFSELSISQKAWYNKGNAHFRSAAIAQGEEKVKALRSAIASYKQSIQLSPDLNKAKSNYEIADRHLKKALKDLEDQKKQQDQNQDQEKKEQPKPDLAAQQALEKTMRLAKQGLYTQAEQLLSNTISSNPTATSYHSFLERIKAITQLEQGITPEIPKATPPVQPNANSQLNRLPGNQIPTVPSNTGVTL